MKQLILSTLLFFITFTLGGCTTLNPTKPIVATPNNLPVAKALPSPKIILVLGSGGSRGLAHIGVLKVLKRHHISIDMIVTTDTGSLVATLYAEHGNLTRTTQKLLAIDPTDLLDVSTLHLLTGPLSGDAIQSFILQNLSIHELNHLKIPTVLVATDLRTGDPYPMMSGPIAPAVNAAMALPPYFQPMHLYRKILIDGATVDPIPVDIAKTYQPKIIIAVNLAPSFVGPMPTNIVGIYDRVYGISEQTFNHLSAQGADIIIHPEVPYVYAPDMPTRLKLIKAGEVATNAALPKICALLQANHIASDCSQAAPLIPPKQIEKKKMSKFLQIKQFIKNPHI